MRVLTVNGRKIKKVNSIMYNNSFYSKRDDCVKIGGKYYAKVDEAIAIDHQTGEYNLKSKMRHGIVSFNGDKPVFGYFSFNRFTNEDCYYTKRDRLPVISSDIVPVTFFESLNKGTIFCPEAASLVEKSEFTKPKTVNSHQDKGYNIEDNPDEYEDMKLCYTSYNPYISKKIRRYANFLGNLTFGIETEVVVGNLPKRIKDQCALVFCRDGSTPGGEYVSVPMSGAKGVDNIRRIGVEMSKRTLHDHNCSYHVHIGGMEISRVFLLALHKLVELVQDELFTMLPYYKTFWRNIKRKDYNQKLELLFPLYEKNPPMINTFKEYVDYNYYVLYRNLAGKDRLPSKDNNRENLFHPQDPNGNAKWNIHARYHCVNFINAIFSKRKTIEFRSFQNTTNPTKMVTWLFICAAFIKYAEKHSTEILTKKQKISLADVINIYKENSPISSDAAFLSEYLIAYVEDRKKYFFKLMEEEDYKALDDTKNDKTFTFLYKGKSLV